MELRILRLLVLFAIATPLVPGGTTGAPVSLGWVGDVEGVVLVRRDGREHRLTENNRLETLQLDDELRCMNGGRIKILFSNGGYAWETSPVWSRINHAPHSGSSYSGNGPVFAEATRPYIRPRSGDSAIARPLSVELGENRLASLEIVWDTQKIGTPLTLKIRDEMGVILLQKKDLPNTGKASLTSQDKTTLENETGSVLTVELHDGKQPALKGSFRLMTVEAEQTLAKLLALEPKGWPPDALAYAHANQLVDAGLLAEARESAQEAANTSAGGRSLAVQDLLHKLDAALSPQSP